MSIRHTTLELVSRMPLPMRAFRYGSGADCAVFITHAVVAGVPPPHLANMFRCKTAASYEADLRWLIRRFQFVGYEDVEASLNGTRPLPKNAALLTFDDGFAEVHSTVRPILRGLGIPALIFVTKSLLDNRTLSEDCKASLCIDRLLNLDPAQRASLLKTAGVCDYDNSQSVDVAPQLRRLLLLDGTITDSLWSHFGLDEWEYLHDSRPFLTSEQVMEMSSDGFSFGGHATAHRRLQDFSLRELEEDIVQSCEAVIELTGEPTVPFAFPYTGQGIRRDWLASIQTRHSCVGLFFDVGGLKRERSLVWHRLNIEEPGESVGTTVRRAYLLALRDAATRAVRNVFSGQRVPA